MLHPATSCKEVNHASALSATASTGDLPRLRMIYANTLMFQRVLSEPIWAGRMGPDERRGMTPLACGHVNPYGTFRLDMTIRLPLDMPGPGTDSPQLSLLNV